MKRKVNWLLLLSMLFISSCGNSTTSSSSSSFSELSSFNSMSENSSSIKQSSESSFLSEDSSSIFESSNSNISHTSVTNTVSNYYSSIDLDATGGTLMNALHSKIKTHKTLSYDSLPTYYQQTDKKSDGKVWDMYSNKEFSFDSSDKCGNYSKEGDCWNREHSIPKSWFDDKSPMYSDIFHLYPTDGYVNNRRSNYPFGEVVSGVKYTSSNGCKLGIDSGGNIVFEPTDEYKGDFARTYFYFATCYMDKTINLGNGSTVFTSSTSYPKLTDNSINLFIKWAEDDPVSQKEIDRNNACYNIQQNRNPFIDYPEFANQIWGSLA